MNPHGLLDAIDQRLLTILQARARTKRNELAEQTGLSIPAVSERLKKLEESGIIQAYCAIIDHKKLGFDVSSFIMVTVDSSKHFPAFIDRCHKTAEVLECHAITGEGTHLLKVRVKNTVGLEKLLAGIQSWPGVIETVTRVALSSPKETTHLPMTNNHAGKR